MKIRFRRTDTESEMNGYDMYAGDVNTPATPPEETYYRVGFVEKILSLLGTLLIISAFALPFVSAYVDLGELVEHTMAIGGLGFVLSLFSVAISTLKKEKGAIGVVVAVIIVLIAVAILRGTCMDFLTYIFSLL